MKLRPYRDGDFPALCRWIADERAYALWCANRVPWPLAKEAFDALLRDIAARFGDAPFTALSDQGEPVGFFCLSGGGEKREGMLKFVIVDSAARNRGFGTQMIRLALDTAFAREGVEAVRLNVFSENPGAVRCYQKAGFAQVDAAPDALRFGDERWTRLSMIALNPVPRSLTVNGAEYAVLRLLGKGKGGYSHLVERDGARYVLKQLHHEPCDYYQFGDKLAAERADYRRLAEAGIPVPRLIEVDEAHERLLKAYVPGPTAFELVRDGGLRPEHLARVRALSEQARAAGINLDWFPTNFVADGDALWYVDYECNDYMPQWSFETWGVRYWSRTPEFEAHLAGQ